MPDPRQRQRGQVLGRRDKAGARDRPRGRRALHRTRRAAGSAWWRRATRRHTRCRSSSAGWEGAPAALRGGTDRRRCCPNARRVAATRRGRCGGVPDGRRVGSARRCRGAPRRGSARPARPGGSAARSSGSAPAGRTPPSSDPGHGRGRRSPAWSVAPGRRVPGGAPRAARRPSLSSASPSPRPRLSSSATRASASATASRTVRSGSLLSNGFPSVGRSPGGDPVAPARVNHEQDFAVGHGGGLDPRRRTSRRASRKTKSSCRHAAAIRRATGVVVVW